MTLWITVCRRTLSWEPWRWERICVFPQRCGSPAPFLRARRRPEWTSSLKSWVWPRWPTPRCVYTHASGPRLLFSASVWKCIFQGKMRGIQFRISKLSRNELFANRGFLREIKVHLSGCFASGGHSGDARDLWGREEEDEHRHGADYWPLGALSGRTNLGAGCQHRQLCPVIAEKVQKKTSRNGSFQIPI